MTEPAGDRQLEGRNAGVFLAFAAAAAGFEAQIVQIVLLRELLTFFSGLEIVIGMVLGIWMAFTAAGAFAGGRISRPGPGARLAICLTAAGLWAAAALAAIRVSRGILGVESGEEPSLAASALLASLAAGPAAALLGAAFPAAAELLAGSGRHGGPAAAGKAFLYEAAGGALAGVGFTFAAAHVLNPFQSVFLAAGVAAAAACAAAGMRSWPAAALPALFTVLFALAGPADRITEKARWRDFNDRYAIAETADSKYGRIAVLEYRGEHSFFESGHLAFSLPDLEASAELANMVMVQHRRPENVLVVGGALAGLAREILKYPVKSLEVVELDSKLAEIALKYMPPDERALLSSGRARMHHEDGRLFVKRSEPASYDIVLLCLPDPSTASLNRFYTAEFYGEVRRVLRPGGLCAFTLSSAENYIGSELLRRNGSAYHTFMSAFPHIRVIPGDPAVFLGSDDSSYLSLDPDELAIRFLAAFPDRENDVPAGAARWFTPHHYHLRMDSADVLEVNRTLRAWPAGGPGRESEAGQSRPLPAFLAGGAENGAPWDEEVSAAARDLNSDLKPSASLATLLIWCRKTGMPSISGLLESLSSLHPALLALPGLLLFVPGAGLIAAGKRRAARRFSVSASVFAVGLAQMVVELSVLYAFQSYYGYVYSGMGLLFAVFMGGLAAGAYASGTRLPEKPGAAFIPVLLACCILVSVCLPWALEAAGAAGSPALVFAVFAALAFLSGMPVGLMFPQAAAAEGGGAGSASALYACDLAGGIAGSLAAAPLLIPCAGLSATLRVFAPAILAGALLACAASNAWKPSDGAETPGA